MLVVAAQTAGVPPSPPAPRSLQLFAYPSRARAPGGGEGHLLPHCPLWPLASHWPEYGHVAITNSKRNGEVGSKLGTLPPTCAQGSDPTEEGEEG